MCDFRKTCTVSDQQGWTPRLFHPVLKECGKNRAGREHRNCHFLYSSSSKKRRCSTFLSLTESREDKQVSRFSLGRAWESTRKEKARKGEKKTSWWFACVSAYLTNDRKIKAWQSLLTAGMEGEEGEGNLTPSHTCGGILRPSFS